MKRPWTHAETRTVGERYSRGDRVEQIAVDLDRTVTAIHNKARELGVRFGENRPKAKPAFTIQSVPSPNRSVDQIIRDQAERFREKRERWESKHQGIEVVLDEPGPYAILFFGDPHADDDGCDLEKLSYDLEIARNEPHVFGANMGDLTNNWIGRLKGLYAHQHTTDDEAEALLEWLVQSIPWMFVILGNHDKWGPLASRICRDNEVTAVSHGAKFIIRDRPNGRPFTVDARHNHPGNSMYNPAHGQLKKSYRGSDANLIIGAHIHNSAYTQVKNPETGVIGHAVRVAAYKRFDEYADANGFADSAISPSVLVVVDPEASPEGFVTVFADVDQGVRFLRALRNEFNPVSESRIAA